jgi:hypothetical protein
MLQSGEREPGQCRGKSEAWSSTGVSSERTEALSDMAFLIVLKLNCIVSRPPLYNIFINANIFQGGVLVPWCQLD